MPTFQNAAPGAKSSKFADGLNNNIFTPFLAQPGDLDGTEETTAEPTLTAEFDQRIRLQERGAASQMPMGAGQGQYESSTVPQNGASNGNSNNTNGPVYNIENNSNTKDDKQKKTNDDEDDDDKSDGNDDSDFDDDDFDFDDDPTLEAIRQRRLAELKRQQESLLENKAKGHGDYRIISQDEFLPECTSSKYVAVHFFHNDFERCKIMEHHLKRIASQHLNCKFVAVNAEKTPFFVTKLQVKTLPTVIVFKDGKAIDRLTGFEGLADSIDKPDEFPTSRLGRWMESTGAIEYEGPDSDEEGERQGQVGRATSSRMYQSRFHAYDEDH